MTEESINSNKLPWNSTTFSKKKKDCLKSKKIFVGGLVFTTTKKQLTDYFSQFGTVNDSIIIVDRDGKPRGFGFVTFQDQSSIDKVLETTSHKIADKLVECKLAFPKALLEAEEQNKKGKETKQESSEDDTHKTEEIAYNKMYEGFNCDAFSTSKTGEVQVSQIPEKAFSPNEKIEPQLRKVFVGGLPHNLELPQFQKYFAQFGTIDDIVIL